MLFLSFVQRYTKRLTPQNFKLIILPKHSQNVSIFLKNLNKTRCTIYFSWLIQKKVVILHTVWNKYQLTIFKKEKIAMSKICQITGKKAMIGNNVSHSKHRTKRTFDVNLFSKKFFYVEESCWISLKISAAGLRLINKVGLDAALKQAVSKGYVDWKDIKVIGE